MGEVIVRSTKFQTPSNHCRDVESYKGILLLPQKVDATLCPNADRHYRKQGTPTV